MTEYTDLAAAAAAGFRIIHQAERQRFALVRDDGAGRVRVIGEAHYTLFGESAIDFDHTVVEREFRGTGLSALLAERALTDVLVQGRTIRASCWYIEQYLERHPHLAEPGSAGAEPTGTGS